MQVCDTCICVIAGATRERMAVLEFGCAGMWVLRRQALPCLFVTSGPAGRDIGVASLLHVTF